MKKQLLLFLSFFVLLVPICINAQTGTITIVSIQSPIEAGTAGAIEVTYTSDIACKLNIQLRETNANETTVNYGPWNGQMDVTDLAVAATPTTVSFNYNIAGTQKPSSDLSSGVQYTFVLKLVGDNAEGEYGYNNGKTENITEVTASTSVVNSANFTSVPTTIAAGDNLTANFEYTLTNEGKVKVDVRKYDGDTWLSDGLVAEAFVNPAAATSASAVTDSKILTIAGDTPTSSSLTGNENYKTVVTLYDSTWTFIMQTKSDLTITTSLGVEEVKEDVFTFYPNPVENILMIKSNILQVKSMKIFDMTGRTIKVIPNAENLKSIDVSDFTKGLYIIHTNNNKQYTFLKK
ncbi:T9SS type A sorting domain-containing protein [uncultured Polaribacter sp.]|uniref:T9SS type A sorting domain-containing protein n=1 Tax=uncultured Polaribacter sp. TaxID=174711 RepID=UPI00262DEE97|nr:T9SS type A sorting domain-containing protein [uncultured Polaribacter sp.]